MPEVEIVQGRKISGLEIAEINALIEANPLWSRYRLSRDLARRWEWYSAAGELKDMAARALLQKLHQRGYIGLPELRRGPVRRSPTLRSELFDSIVPGAIVGDLSSLLPLKIQVTGPKQPDYHLFQRYLAQHHYLGYGGPIGENLGYLIRSCAGAELGCLLFGAAAWQCACRDRWIGWRPANRRIRR